MPSGPLLDTIQNEKEIQGHMTYVTDLTAEYEEKEKEREKSALQSTIKVAIAVGRKSSSSTSSTVNNKGVEKEVKSQSQVGVRDGVSIFQSRVAEKKGAKIYLLEGTVPERPLRRGLSQDSTAKQELLKPSPSQHSKRKFEDEITTSLPQPKRLFSTPHLKQTGDTKRLVSLASHSSKVEPASEINLPAAVSSIPLRTVLSFPISKTTFPPQYIPPSISPTSSITTVETSILLSPLIGSFRGPADSSQNRELVLKALQQTIFNHPSDCGSPSSSSIKTNRQNHQKGRTSLQRTPSPTPFDFPSTSPPPINHIRPQQPNITIPFPHQLQSNTSTASFHLVNHHAYNHNSIQFLGSTPTRVFPPTFPSFPTILADRFEVQEYIHDVLMYHNFPPLLPFALYTLSYTGQDMHCMATENTTEANKLLLQFVTDAIGAGLKPEAVEILHDEIVNRGMMYGKRPGGVGLVSALDASKRDSKELGRRGSMSRKANREKMRDSLKLLRRKQEFVADQNDTMSRDVDEKGVPQKAGASRTCGAKLKCIIKAFVRMKITVTIELGKWCPEEEDVGGGAVLMGKNATR